MNYLELKNLLATDLKKAEAVISADRKLLDLRSSAMKETLLHYFSIENQLPIVQCLLQLGADINARDASEATPLIYAASLNYPELVDLLIKKGADKSLQDNNGDTALFRAVENGSMKSVKALLDAGADPHALNGLGQCLEDVVPRKHLETLKTLLGSTK